MPQRSAYSAEGPHSLEAEEAVLSIILSGRDSSAYALAELEPQDFYFETHRLIFESARRLRDQRSEQNRYELDYISISQDLGAHQLLDRIGGSKTLLTFTQLPTLIQNDRYYVNLVKEKAKLRRLMGLFSGLSQEAAQDTRDPEELLDQASEKLFEIREGSQRKGPAQIGEIVARHMDELAEQAEKGTETAIRSGFPSLDSRLGGLRKGSLIVLAARPSMGKSALAFNIAENVSFRYHVPTLIFSLEMSKEEVSLRFTASQLKINSQKLKESQLSTEEWKTFGRHIRELYEAPVYIDDRSLITPLEMLSTCKDLRLRVPELGLVVVDYMQLVASNRSRQDNRQQEVSDISRSLKIMARELDVPVIALSQLSRSCESRSDKRPLLSDLRDSGAIEQDADAVLFLYRDFYYLSEEEKQLQNGQPQTAELIVAKNRHGETSTVKLGWNPQYTLFYEPENPYQHGAPPPEGF